MSDDVSRETAAPPAPPEARGVFAERLPQAMAYADLLAADATVRGLIGPREVPRLWERHLLNCAVVTDLIEPGQRVADIGSGAGLPGLVMAIRRPDLQITLIEPLLRRTTFLELAVTTMELSNVVVHRGRAEEFRSAAGAEEGFDVVTSRAVAPLGRLAAWSLPLTRPGGRMLAMKGRSAADEMSDSRRAVARAGGVDAQVLTVGAGATDPVTTVVSIRRDASGRTG